MPCLSNGYCSYKSGRPLVIGILVDWRARDTFFPVLMRCAVSSADAEPASQLREDSGIRNNTKAVVSTNCKLSLGYIASRVIDPLIIRQMPNGLSFFNSSGRRACGKSW